MHAEQSNIDVPVHNVTDNHDTIQFIKGEFVNEIPAEEKDDIEGTYANIILCHMYALCILSRVFQMLK